jgi:hypothetical protein
MGSAGRLKKKKNKNFGQDIRIWGAFNSFGTSFCALQ